MSHESSQSEGKISSKLSAPKRGETVVLGGKFKELRLADYPQLRAVVDCRNYLGEAPIWQPLDRSVWWIDVFAPAVYRLDVSSGQVQHRILPRLAGAVVPHHTGGVLLVLRSGLMVLPSMDAEPKMVQLENGDLAGFRFNDAKVDCKGQLWVGTFDPSFRRFEGTLRSVAGNPPAAPRLSDPFDRGMGLADGLGWSPDHRTMYFTDSLARTIYAYDFDAASGAVSHRREFVRLSSTESRGSGHDGPDGLAVDSEGNVWSAQLGSWCINCYAPNGALSRSLHVPTAHPSSCIFGGHDLSTLYVTTARMGLTPEELAAQPCAGSLLAIDIGARGTPVGSFVGA